MKNFLHWKNPFKSSLVLLLGACVASTASFAQEKESLMPMELDGTQWAIDVVSINKKGQKEMAQDILTFSDKKLISENYKKKGFEPTNYSLSVSEDDVTSFGTMQIKDKETTFWKGAIQGEAMDGSIHIQRPSGNNVTEYFTGKLMGGALQRKSAAKPVVQPPTPPVPVHIPADSNTPVPVNIQEQNGPDASLPETVPAQIQTQQQVSAMVGEQGPAEIVVPAGQPNDQLVVGTEAPVQNNSVVQPTTAQGVEPGRDVSGNAQGNVPLKDEESSDWNWLKGKWKK